MNLEKPPASQCADEKPLKEMQTPALLMGERRVSCPSALSMYEFIREEPIVSAFAKGKICSVARDGGFNGPSRRTRD